MAVDPRAVSVFVVATKEAELEVHGALLANEIGRFVHEWSPYRLVLSLHVAHTALHVQVSRVIRCAFGVWYREPDYSSLALSLCAAWFVVAGVARRHAVV